MEKVTVNVCNRLVELGIIFLIIFAPIYYGSVHLEMMTVIELTILFMLLVWGVETAARGEFVFRRTPLDIVILLFCVYCVISTLFISRYAHASRQWLPLVLCISALYFIVVNHIRSSKQLMRLFVAILLVGFTHAFSHLMQNATGLLRASTGVMFNIGNHFAGYMVLIIPLAVAVSFVVRDIGKRILLMFAGIVMAAAMAFSLIAGAMLAFLLSLILIGLLFARSESTRKQALILTGVVTCSLLIILWFGHTPVLNELLTVTNLKAGSPAGRLSLWRSSLAMFANDPVTGTGLGTFDSVYPRYRLPDMYGRAVYAHSDWLQLLTELGVIGFVIALLGSVFFFVWALKKASIVKFGNDWTKGLTVGGLSSVGAGLAHALVEFNLHIPAIAVLFTIIIAMTVAASLSSVSATERPSIRIRMPTPVRIASPICLFLMVSFFGVLLLRPCIANAHHKDAVELEAAIQWDEAVERYQSALSLSRSDGQHLYSLGNVYAKRVTMTRGTEMQETWYRLASAAYHQAIKLCPTNGDYYLVLGNLYETVGNMEDAGVAYEKTISLDPNNAFYHKTYGTFCLKQGDVQKALAEYKESLEVYPGDLRDILDTGYLILDTRWKDLASSICPEDVNSRITLAQFFVSEGWHDAAYSEYKRAIALAPERIDLWKHLSGWMKKQGRLDEAASLWRQFLKSHPQNAQACAELAAIYVRQKRMDDGIQQLLVAAGIEPDNPDFLMKAAKLYVQQGRSDRAVELWQTVIRQNPHTAAGAYYRLGRYYENQGNWIDALSFLQQAISADPKNTGYRVYLAQGYYKRELFYEAIREWKRALKLQPENVSVHLQLARVYQQIDRQDKAKEHYRKVLKLQPENTEAQRISLDAEDSVQSSGMVHLPVELT